MLKMFCSAAFACLMVSVATARDDFDYPSDPETKQWYRSLMQPDNPTISCCGEADAWWADSFGVDENGPYAIITDDRPDEHLGRRHIENGTKVPVPNHKYKWDGSNPTGHGVLFIGPSGQVLCYVQSSGA